MSHTPQTTARKVHLLTLLTAAIMVGCTSSEDTPEITFERANILADRGKFDDAVPVYTKALEGMPGHPDVLFRRGLCYESLELNEKALADYSACLEIDPMHTDAINNKGVILAKLGQFEEAAAQFSALLRDQPDNVLALRNRGLCFHDLERFDDALADYTAAIKMAPEDVNNWFQRGNAYLEQDRFDDAVADFSRAIEIDPGFAKAWMNRGVALFGLDDRDNAMKDLEQARELDDNIIIPGIDWKTVGTMAELAPVTSVTVAKPVLVLQTSRWKDMLEFATKHLQQAGFTDIKAVVEVAGQNCGRLKAAMDGQPISVYVCLVSDKTSDALTLPALSDDDTDRALLMIEAVEADDSDEQSLQVAQFIEQWQPATASISPITVRVQLAE